MIQTQQKEHFTGDSFIKSAVKLVMSKFFVKQGLDEVLFVISVKHEQGH